MNSLLKIKFLLCVTRTMKPYSREETIDKLLPIAYMHRMTITMEEATLPENDPLVMMAGIENSPKNRIRFSDVVSIMDYEGFLWIYLRTGYIHMLSKDKPVRMYNHMMLDNVQPPGRLKMFWYRLQTYFIKMIHGKELTEINTSLKSLVE